jgi:hypothetical protein
MRFFISRKDNLVAIDNVAASVDCSSLDTTVAYVIWNENGSGFVEPATGVALRTTFTDPSPYQTIIDAWMTAQIANGLTLAQAQMVKTEFVQAIYLSKIQAPVSVATSLGTFSFDPTDILSGPLNIGSWLPAVAALISDLNTTQTDIATAISDLVTSLNTQLGDIGTTFGEVNTYTASEASSLNGILNGTFGSINSYTNALASTLSSNFLTINETVATSVDTTFAGTTLGTSNDLVGSTLGTTFEASGAYTGPSAISALTAAVKMLPIGQTSFPNFTLADQFAVITAIQNQRNNETVVKATKNAVIAGLTTVANVIALDVTTGW